MAMLNWSWLQPDLRPRLYTQEQTLTGQELATQVTAISQQLQAVSPEGKLAVCSHNSTELYLLALACLDAGWTFQPISPRWPLAMRNRLAQQVQSDWIWPQEAFDKSWPGEPPKLLDWQIGCWAKAQPTAVFKAKPSLPSSTLFTSGSTGNPKAVTHRLEQHLAAADFCNPILGLDDSSCWLLSLPLFHASGYAILMRCLRAGAAIAMPEKPGVSIGDLKRYPVTHVSLVATQLQRLIQVPDFNPSSLSLKHLMLGGGPMPEKLLQQALDRGFEVSMSYGMTETAAAIALSQITSDAGIKSNTNIRLHRDEIQVRGPQVADTYLLQSGTQVLANKQGWFSTGDLGRIENDKLYIEGRKDNRFISGGENIQPELIEQALQQHPAIELALVVPTSDPEFGQRPVAFIQSQEVISPQVLDTWLKEKLPSFMLPAHYLSWPTTIGHEQKPIRAEFIKLAQQKCSLIDW